MTKFRIYNGEVSNVSDRIIGGKGDSGIRDWDNIKYPAMLDFSEELFGEYWIENEVKLGKDIEEYRDKLNDRERYVYNTITAKLNWLDSMATDFNFLLGMISTDSSVRSVISLISAFEQLHNRSYQYLTSSVLNYEEKKKAFEDTQKIPQLAKRNDHIIKYIEKMSEAIKLKLCDDVLPEDKRITHEELVQAVFEGLIAYMVLEGLYFAGGFVYFHSLARDQKMMGSNDMIRLIKTDENMHSVFYGTYLQILMKENPFLNTEENHQFAQDFVKKAVELEKEWATYIFEGIETMSLKEYMNHAEYLANLLFRNAGMSEPYPENKDLKSQWIVTYGSKSSTGQDGEIMTRTDFLQSNTINYEHEGGGDFDL